MFSLGAELKPLNKLTASVEYKFLGILGVSLGYNGGNLGVNDGYQSDLNYANKFNSFAGGVFVNVTEMITINAGFTYVNYDDYSKAQSYTPLGFPGALDFTDTYAKNTKLFAIGVDFSF
jgi:hypothetical protein